MRIENYTESVFFFKFIKPLLHCRSVRVRSVPGRSWLGPTQREADRAVSQGPVHDDPSRARLRHQHGTTQVEQPVRVSRVQETEAHGSDLHLPAVAEDESRSDALDAARSGPAL